MIIIPLERRVYNSFYDAKECLESYIQFNFLDPKINKHDIIYKIY